MKRPLRERTKTFASALLLAGLLPLFSGCNDLENPIAKIVKGDPIDSPLNLTQGDYRHLAKPKDGQIVPKVEISGAPPIPDIAPILAAPLPPKIAANQLVSIAVTDDVPLKDLLLELAKLANVDIELDASIQGGISFVARNKPFNEVIARIADLADLRYTMKGGVLRVERDTPYVKTYALDFLNMDRSVSNTGSVNTGVLSSSSGGGSSGGGSSGGGFTGSTTSITSSATADFWKSLEEGIKQILTYSMSKRTSNISGLLDSKDVLAAVAKNADAPKGAPQAEPPVVPAAPAAATAPPAASASSDAKKGEGFYILNRQGGILTVSATNRQHEMLKRFLDQAQSNASSQVLIEAKILEVGLNEEYSTGIDWNRFHVGTDGTIDPLFKFTSNNVLKISGDTVVGAISYTDKNLGLDGIAKFLNTFGAVRTLSSPRLHAINNQTATLTFAQNEVYFTVATSNTVTPTSSQAIQQNSVTSTAHTVPIGIIMAIQPSINLESNEITLNVKPTLSTLVKTVIDPASPTDKDGKPIFTNTVPVVQIRELDSILKLKSGQVMVIGGLMQQSSSNTDSGIPGIATIPIFGNLFKSVAKTNKTSELIILIRAQIVSTNGDFVGADKTIYNKFTDDPRPLTY